MADNEKIKELATSPQGLQYLAHEMAVGLQTSYADCVGIKFNGERTSKDGTLHLNFSTETGREVAGAKAYNLTLMLKPDGTQEIITSYTNEKGQRVPNDHVSKFPLSPFSGHAIEDALSQKNVLHGDLRDRYPNLHWSLQTGLDSSKRAEPDKIPEEHFTMVTMNIFAGAGNSLERNGGEFPYRQDEKGEKKYDEFHGPYAVAFNARSDNQRHSDLVRQLKAAGADMNDPLPPFDDPRTARYTPEAYLAQLEENLRKDGINPGSELLADEFAAFKLEVHGLYQRALETLGKTQQDIHEIQLGIDERIPKERGTVTPVGRPQKIEFSGPAEIDETVPLSASSLPQQQADKGGEDKLPPR